MINKTLKLGARSSMLLGSLLVFIWALNGLIVYIDLWLMLTNDIGIAMFILFILALVWAISFSIYSAWRLYKRVTLEIFKLFLEEAGPLRKKMSEELLMNFKANLQENTFSEVKMIDQQFQSFPWIFQFPIKFILRQIPIAKLIGIANKALLEENSIKACDQFNQELDILFREIYLEFANVNWVYWLLPVLLLGHGILTLLLYFGA